MTISARLIKGLKVLLIYVLGLVIVLFALTISVTRLLLPELGGYKNNLLEYISTEYNLDVERFDITWDSWSPRFHLQDVRVSSKQAYTDIIVLDYVAIEVDTLPSLLALKIIPKTVSMRGGHFSIWRNLNGTIYVNDSEVRRFNNSQDFSSDWLWQAETVTLNDIDIVWHDLRYAVLEESLSCDQIKLKNTFTKRHVIKFSCNHPDSQKLTAEVNIKTRGSWDGYIDMHVAELDLENWSNYLSAFTDIKIKGRLNLEFQARWDTNGFVGGHGYMSDVDAVFVNKKGANLPIKVDKWAVKSSQAEGKILLDMQITALQNAENAPWVDTNLYMEIDQQNTQTNYQGTLSFMQFEGLLPFLAQTNMFSASSKQLESIYTGTLQDINFEVICIPQLCSMQQLSADFATVSYAIDANIFSNLSGHVHYQQEYINIQLDSNEVYFYSDKLYQQALNLDYVNAQLGLDLADSRLDINTARIVQDKKLDLALQGKIWWDLASVEFSAKTDSADIRYVSKFFPQKLYPRLHRWLDQSLVAGDIQSLELDYQGALDPASVQNNLRFTASIGHTSLNYLADWPLIHDISADIILENNHFTAYLSEGRSLDVHVDSMIVDIADIAYLDTLVLQADFDATAEAMRAWLKQTNLTNKSHHSAKMLAMDIHGDIAIGLELMMPLKQPDEPVVDAVFYLKDVMLNDIDLEQVRGRLHFSGNTIAPSRFSAIYQDQPIEFTLHTENQGNAHKFMFSSALDKALLLASLRGFAGSNSKNLADKLEEILYGMSDWNMVFYQSVSGAPVFELSSDLKGLGIDAPYPIGKTKDQSQLFHLKIEPRSSHTIFTLSYMDYIQAIFSSTQSGKLKDIAGLQGTIERDLSKYDLLINAHLDTLDLSAWRDFFTSHGQSSEAPLSIFMEIEADNLSISSYSLEQTKLILSVAQKFWEAQLTGQKIAADIKYMFGNNMPDSLIADLQYLALEPSDRTGTDKPVHLSPEHFPALQLKIAQFNYRGLDLGRLALLLRPYQYGVVLEEMTLLNPEFSLHLQGEWQKEIDQFDLEVNLNAESTDAFARMLNHHETMFSGHDIKLKSDLHWENQPLSLQILEQVKASVDIEMDDVYLPIKQSMSDMAVSGFFSLFDLTKLPRRLILDFDDIFDDGLYFESLAGHFNIDRGHVYTNNLSLESSTVDLNISGRTGLIERDYDQIVTVTPRFNARLPLVGTLFGPVGTGVGAVLLFADNLFDFIPDAVDQTFSSKYRITGSWDSPELIELD